jgi:hypothetical protein
VRDALEEECGEVEQEPFCETTSARRRFPAALGLHSFLTDCTGCKLCGPQETCVHVGFGAGDEVARWPDCVGQ